MHIFYSLPQNLVYMVKILFVNKPYLYINARATRAGVSRAKIVAVATTTRGAHCLSHARFIALNQATDTRYQFKQGQKLLPQFRYIACLVYAHCVR